MARYYLVQYTQRDNGDWVSPPECEDHWASGCFKQVRFDNASGVALVKCLGSSPLPVGEELGDPSTDVRTWLAGIERFPKDGPTPDDPQVPMTLDEEHELVRRIGASFVGAD